jgi:hypothetical protein
VVSALSDYGTSMTQTHPAVNTFLKKSLFSIGHGMSDPLWYNTPMKTITITLTSAEVEKVFESVDFSRKQYSDSIRDYLKGEDKERAQKRVDIYNSVLKKLR